MNGCTPPRANPVPEPQASAHESNGFRLQAGDLLFQDLDCGDICHAIEAVTHGVDGANLSHVAIVSRVEGDRVYVIEAYAQGVVEVELEALLGRSRDEQGRPKVLVGRMKPEYAATVPRALEAARARLGKPYDEAFALGNGKYYCSELLYEAFLEANGGQPVFDLQPMTFRAPAGDATAPAWAAYYRELGLPVPEGEPGLNPGGMSTSPFLTIVHAFGSPSGYRPSKP